MKRCICNLYCKEYWVCKGRGKFKPLTLKDKTIKEIEELMRKQNEKGRL